MSTSSQIVSERQGAIHRLAFNRPEKKNALSLAMYVALTEGLSGAQEEPGVRVILLEGSESCFTAGNDIADFASGASAEKLAPIFSFLEALHRCTKPIVASVNGVAVGIGTTALLHCDLVFAGESARFQLPFVNLGLCPEAASSLLLPRAIGYQRAAELLMLGEPFTAARAHALGLVNHVSPDPETRDAARHAAEKLAGQPPAALRLTKELLKKGLAAQVSQTMADEGQHFLARLASPEAAEAFMAFALRRKPDFTQFS